MIVIASSMLARNTGFALGDIPEKVLRTVVVYFAIVILLRVFGKRELAQLNSFDLVVLLLLSNVVQNAIVTDGTYDEHALARLGLRHGDVETAIRRQGAASRLRRVPRDRLLDRLADKCYRRQEVGARLLHARQQ